MAPISWLTADFVLERLRKVKLVLADCDGTLTDAGIYVSERGEELVRFSRRDGMGFDLLRIAGILSGIVTQENSAIVRARAQKLKVNELHLGALNKADTVAEIKKRLGLEKAEVAFIGDDINDLRAFSEVGFTACPADAASEVKQKADWVLTQRGGYGAFRELADALIDSRK